MTLKTRRPTGLPSWPIVLLAGVEKSGKSWQAAAASGSDLIGRTLWLSLGEDDPDEYAAVPGADFEIVEHDGTYLGFLSALDEAVKESRGADPATLIVLDSATRLWNLLSDMAQDEANRRAAAKARKQNRGAPDGDVQITMDLWNTAKDRWTEVIDLLREHQGPSIVTARLETVTVMDDNGNPTKNKDSKVQGHKTLPYDVGVVVQMPARGEAILTGVRSTRLTLDEPLHLKRGFTIDGLWREMGLAEAVGARHHSPIRPTPQGRAASVEQPTEEPPRRVERQAAPPAQAHAAPPRSAEQPPAAPEGQADAPEAAQGDDEALLAHIFAQAKKAQTADELTTIWKEGAATYKRLGRPEAFGDWAAAQTVTVAPGRDLTLRELFAYLAQVAQQQTAPPAPAEEPGVYAGTPAEDVVDAEVEPDPIPAPTGTEYGVPGRGGYTVRDGVDEEDPWANGGAGVPAPGVEAVAAGLGGEVIDVEGEGVTDNEVRHARAQADAARQAPKQPGNTPPKKSAGRAAVAAAREEIAQRQREAQERGE